MRLPVGADDTRAVDGKQHRQLLDGDVVDHLIVGTLQEGRVNRHNRFIAANRQTCGKGHRVLFGDRDIEILVGIFFGELHHAGAFTHGWGDRHQFGIFGPQFRTASRRRFSNTTAGHRCFSAVYRWYDRI
ncbi:Uncharacterised protein [Kluyvera cryocrescens]|uniref:Uncharacterized protein n=1 Tax=Kluyvera cryocrescens TaxID=580 RepID=A0A485CZ62_KLUCR|nr:Uncharacterised protein [Kluyvera cryocrescens]